MDCVVHGVAKSRIRLSDFHFGVKHKKNPPQVNFIHQSLGPSLLARAQAPPLPAPPSLRPPPTSRAKPERVPSLHRTWQDGEHALCVRLDFLFASFASGGVRLTNQVGAEVGHSSPGSSPYLHLRSIGGKSGLRPVRSSRGSWLPPGRSALSVSRRCPRFEKSLNCLDCKP